eukprot:m.42349 g.42349  ORF g.42349 m.42349 type:complete len:159 (-) comp9872_c0_seq1:993-1469(-)
MAAMRLCASHIATRYRLCIPTARSLSDVVKVAPSEVSEQNAVNALTGIPTEQMKRVVRITEPAIVVTQSGSFKRGGKFSLRWETQERWENPLMGWASSADPLSNLELDFDSLDAAKAYCDKHGLVYNIVEQPKKRSVAGKKSYGANFSWDKRTRRNTK